MSEIEVDFCASLRPEELNFRTKLVIPASTIVQNVKHLFYLKEEYYSESVWRVPIPNTLESKKVFSQNICHLDECSSDRYLIVEQLDNPFHPGKKMALPRFAHNNSYMPFAEALIATKEVILGLGRKCNSKYGILSVRGILDQNPPATVNELSIYMSSTVKDKFKITMEDFIKSHKYWSQYLFRVYG